MANKDWKHRPLDAEDEDLGAVCANACDPAGSEPVSDIWAAALQGGAVALSEKGDRDVLQPPWKKRPVEKKKEAGRKRKAVECLPAGEGQTLNLFSEDLAPTLEIPEGTHLIRSEDSRGVRWTVLENLEWVGNHFEDAVLVLKMKEAIKRCPIYPMQEAYVLVKALRFVGQRVFEPNCGWSVEIPLHIDDDGQGIWFRRTDEEMREVLHPGGPRLILGLLYI